MYSALWQNNIQKAQLHQREPNKKNETLSQSQSAERISCCVTNIFTDMFGILQGEYM